MLRKINCQLTRRRINILLESNHSLLATSKHLGDKITSSERVLVKLKTDRDLAKTLRTSMINILIFRTFIFNNTSQCPKVAAHRCSSKELL